MGADDFLKRLIQHRNEGGIDQYLMDLFLAAQ